jgi:hypothetical protein
MEGDFYVDQKDPTTFWKVPHFGLQNLYDPELDECMDLDAFSHRKGKVTLPAECQTCLHPPFPPRPRTPRSRGRKTR